MKGLLIAGIVSLLAGTAAAMGLGGGFVLLVYLTALAGIPQMEAQWINLIFFLPIGGLALFWHGKNGLIEKKAVIPAVIFGLFGAAGGSFWHVFWVMRCLQGSLRCFWGSWESRNCCSLENEWRMRVAGAMKSDEYSDFYCPGKMQPVQRICRLLFMYRRAASNDSKSLSVRWGKEKKAKPLERF